MPVLAGGRLVGRVDPRRSGSTLVARQISLVDRPDPGALDATAAALTEAAAWVGCTSVAVEQASPPAFKRALAKALRE
jgi:uncharacterized protein YcaQ